MQVRGYNEKTGSWHCMICGEDMGTMNPRQLCGKIWCPNEEIKIEEPEIQETVEIQEMFEMGKRKRIHNINELEIPKKVEMSKRKRSHSI